MFTNYSLIDVPDLHSRDARNANTASGRPSYPKKREVTYGLDVLSSKMAASHWPAVLRSKSSKSLIGRSYLSSIFRILREMAQKFSSNSEIPHTPISQISFDPCKIDIPAKNKHSVSLRNNNRHSFDVSNDVAKYGLPRFQTGASIGHDVLQTALIHYFAFQLHC
jgi:hypothetical protein